ncbi:hypothetical protein J2769_003679 [Acinetobacter guillouiae]|nr:hypothetical protein [Acinetobacter guillouiae]
MVWHAVIFNSVEREFEFYIDNILSFLFNPPTYLSIYMFDKLR